MTGAVVWGGCADGAGAASRGEHPCRSAKGGEIGGG